MSQTTEYGDTMMRHEAVETNASRLEAMLEREERIARAVDILAEMINAGRIASEYRAGVREIMELLYREYNMARMQTRRASLAMIDD